MVLHCSFLWSIHEDARAKTNLMDWDSNRKEEKVRSVGWRFEWSRQPCFFLFSMQVSVWLGQAVDCRGVANGLVVPRWEGVDWSGRGGQTVISLTWSIGLFNTHISSGGWWIYWGLCKRGIGYSIYKLEQQKGAITIDISVRFKRSYSIPFIPLLGEDLRKKKE